MKKYIFIFIGVLVVAGLAYLVSGRLEKKTKEVDIGFTGEARSNSLYAARLFLKKMGIPAQKVNIYQLENLPSTKTVILINTYRSSLSEARIDQLLEWAERGGHLITIIGKSYDEDDVDLLQSRLSIRPSDRRYFRNEFDEKKEKDSDEEYDPKAYISLKGLDKKYAINVSHLDPIATNNEADDKVFLRDVLYLINRQYGKGIITVASDLDFAENKNIEDEDHAELFWQIVHFKNKQIENVWLLNEDEMPSLSSWLWEYAWQLVLTILLFLALWLYSLSPRLGPVIPKESLDRRRLLEHIQASGYFFWKQNEQARLIESSQQSVLQKMGTLFPAWHQLNVDEQLKLLGEYTGQSIDELRSLLYSSEQRSMDEFVHLVQQIESIRKIK